MRTLFMIALAALSLVPTVSWAQAGSSVCMTIDCAMAAQQAGMPKETPEARQDRGNEALCEGDGNMVWKRRGVTYVGLSTQETCVKQQWHVFTDGGPR